MNATSRRAGAASFLFPAAYRRKVLSLLLLNPERRLHVREIARLTGTTAGTLNKELRRLQEAGLLESERVGNQVRYSANRGHPIYPELAGILRKSVGLADVLIEALAPLADRIEAAFVFGSMARGTESADSDIDLLIVGAVEFGSVVDALQAAQQLLARDINPKVYSLREWRSMLRSGDSFAAEVMARPRILLIGSDDEPAKPGRRMP